MVASFQYWLYESRVKKKPLESGACFITASGFGNGNGSRQRQVAAVAGGASCGKRFCVGHCLWSEQNCGIVIPIPARR